MNKGFLQVVISFLFILTTLSTNGQDIIVSGGFLRDSIRIGDITPYYLTARYPTLQTTVFPDSNFSFAPFEFNRKVFFATKSEAGESMDSVVYYLSTFEIDPIQKLQLPVFVVMPKDCLVYRAPLDSIQLIELVKNPPPDSVQASSLPLREDTTYENVLWIFNYPILVIVLVVLLILLIVGWIVFGKKIMRHFRIKKLIRNHQAFLDKYSRGLDELASDFTPVAAEQTLFLWKRYLEKLEKKPFTKLTTRETILLENDDAMGTCLKEIDRAIYGHSRGVSEPLKVLQQIAEYKFEKKLEQARHE